jgi:hypothetical protein
VAKSGFWWRPQRLIYCLVAVLAAPSACDGASPVPSVQSLLHAAMRPVTASEMLPFIKQLSLTSGWDAPV